MRDYGLFMCDLIPLPLKIPFRLFDCNNFLNLALLYRLISRLNRPKKGEIHAICVYSTGPSISNREAILKNIYFDSVIDIIFHSSLLGIL